MSLPADSSPADSSPAESSPARRTHRERSGDQEQRIRLGLIQYVTEHPIDPDYAWVSTHRPALGGRPAQVAAMLVVAAFALLVLIAAGQTTRNAGTDAKERAALVSQIEARRTTLDARQSRVGDLRHDIVVLQDRLLARTDTTLRTKVRRLGVTTGSLAVTGPGVTLVADDAARATSDRERVLDKDLQRLVNGLWAAGAEAVSINGQRITNLTSIRESGSAINVNYIPLRAPYTVKAIGDPDTLASRFARSTSGAAWFDLVQQVGLRLRIATDKDLSIPAADRLVLRYATRPPSGRAPTTDKGGSS